MKRNFAVNTLRNIPLENLGTPPIDYDFTLLNPISLDTEVDIYNGLVKERIYFKDASLMYPLAKIKKTDVLEDGKPAVKKEIYFAYHTAPLQNGETIEQLRQRFEYEERPSVSQIEQLVYNSLDGKEDTTKYYEELRERVDRIIKYLYQQSYHTDKYLATINKPANTVKAMDIIFKKFFAEKEIWTSQAKGQSLTEVLEAYVSGNNEDDIILKDFLSSPTERALLGIKPNERILDYLKLFIKNSYFNPV